MKMLPDDINFNNRHSKEDQPRRSTTDPGPDTTETKKFVIGGDSATRASHSYTSKMNKPKLPSNLLDVNSGLGDKKSRQSTKIVQSPVPFNTGIQTAPLIDEQQVSPRFEGRVSQPRQTIDSEVVFRSMTAHQSSDESFQMVQQSDL